MKIRNLFVMLLLGGSLIFSGSVFTGCASWSNTGKGAAIGAGSGAALGAESELSPERVKELPSVLQ